MINCLRKTRKKEPKERLQEKVSIEKPRQVQVFSLSQGRTLQKKLFRKKEQAT